MFKPQNRRRHDHGNFFPGTGAATEAGTGAGEGLTLNVPWNGPGANDADYIAAFSRVLIPVAYEFAPDLLIVSAGFGERRRRPAAAGAPGLSAPARRSAARAGEAAGRQRLPPRSLAPPEPQLRQSPLAHCYFKSRGPPPRQTPPRATRWAAATCPLRASAT